MSASMKNVDPAFLGAGQKAGIEVWRIENSKPVAVSESSYGKDASEDEADTAAIKTLELDASLGWRAVHYRELQGYETERFLSCFKPCIIPEETEPREHKTRMFVCKGQHVVRVQEVPCTRSSITHDAIYILDSKTKVFQFNGSNTSIQERAKALEVVKYISDRYHHSTCDIATIDDGKLLADAEAGEFWGFFGGFAPLPRKGTVKDAQSNQSTDALPSLLFCVKKGQTEHVAVDSLTKKLLETHNCYLLDFGSEIYVWMGRSTSMEERKSANKAAQEYLRGQDRPKSKIIRMVEYFETVSFRSKFVSWPQLSDVVASQDGRGKVAALLRQRGIDVKGLLKNAPKQEKEEEPQPYIDCSGGLQVWLVNGQEKSLLSETDQSKFYTGDCYIFQYTYTGEGQEECFIGTWFGKESVKEDRDSALSQANSMVESVKFLATQARIYEGDEPFLFYAIFQSFMVLKGGLSNGYKNYISENGLPDETYKEDGIALFRVQGSGPENMQSIQVEPPDLQTRVHKERAESDEFWEILGGKTEHATQKIPREAESDPHLFSCTLSKGEEDLRVTEIHNFNQDDLMTEDIYILDCHTEIFLWVGQEVSLKEKKQALAIGEKRKKRAPVFGGRSASEKPQRSRSVSFGSDRPRARGRSPAFNALASKFDKPVVRNLSTPPQLLSKLSGGGGGDNGGSSSLDTSKILSKSKAIASLTASFDKPIRERLLPRSIKVNSDSTPKSEPNSRVNPMSTRKYSPTIKEDSKEKEVEDGEGVTLYPYDRLTTSSIDPAPDIDVTRREIYLSKAEFREKFNMTKEAFYKMPKWRQIKMKTSLKMF
ncbi:hypothetical protein L1987_70353 [Smallanthus sonchifolius]|uniref:Uncharacterized protein n=1 Tax=Smallanthus sonchifolius TaxID=185202 RepID=A0ACB9APM0_9ASTR|nr:hypothetical protein L1987_70353 [Smallanthus sonchifolius]